MAVSMEAGTAVILTLSPPHLPSIFGRKLPKLLKSSSLFSGASLSSRSSTPRIRNVSQPPNQEDIESGKVKIISINPLYIDYDLFNSVKNSGVSCAYFGMWRWCTAALCLLCLSAFFLFSSTCHYWCESEHEEVENREPILQGDFYGSGNDVNLAPTSALSFAKGLLKFAMSNLLPLALVGGVALGFNSPELGCLAYKYSFSKLITCWLFFLSGLKSQDGDIKEVVEAWPAVLYGLASILLFCPLLSKLILKVQMIPQEFMTGIAIFSCMPTALNGGVALTQIVGGNSALALALTVISVLLGILIVPLWITKFFADVAIPTRKLFQSLLLTLIIPLVLGKILRNLFPGMARYVERNERFFSVTTSILLGFFPWMQVSKSRQLLLLVKPEIFVSAILIGIIVHLSFLVFNATLVRSLSVGSSSWKSVFDKQENRRALVLVCSQRSLLIATAVVEQLGGVLGESGLLLLPCVAGDVNQIIIDPLLVNFWLRKDESCDIVKKP